LKPRGGAKSALNARARHIPRVQEITDPEIAQVLKLYEEAMRRFNKQNFRRAKELLEKVTAGPSRELAERARVHLAICEQRLQRSAPVSLRSAEDHYHYAVARMNVSDYGTARQHLEKAVRLAPKADHIHYALAALASLEGKAEEALEHLARAIKLQPQNRTQARKDEDFRFLEGDPRFQSLLQPEAAEARA
jgi:tetratricopeptide (TPR) repeat protein